MLISRFSTLLFLLTIGFLSSVAGLAIFFIKTDGEEQYLTVWNEIRLLHQLQVQTVILLDGDETGRQAQIDLISRIDALMQGKPPGAEARTVWDGMKPHLMLIAQRPVKDTEARTAYEAIKPKFPALQEVSYATLRTVRDRGISARNRTLGVVALMAVLTICLLGLCIVFMKKNVARATELADAIAERRRLEEQLSISQKRETVGRLASGIAHEFGNVLTVITGYNALLTNNLKPDDPLRTEAEGIRKATQRATSLVRHLLGFSRNQVVCPTVIKLSEALPRMRDMLLRLVGEDIDLTTVCSADVGTIRFDPSQLEQIFVNLALNARDAMPTGGSLKIQAERVYLAKPLQNRDDKLARGDYVRLRVVDTGCGMTPEVRGRLFEPFFSTKERGTGLGLSMVNEMVRESGGTIFVESELNHGTSFTILLPCLSYIAKQAAGVNQSFKSSQPVAVKGTETILLVEDQHDVRWLVQQMLVNQGYEVIEAANQQQAISICSQTTPTIHLMLTDVVMPHMSGPQLAVHVRDLRPRIKILYMSGYARDRFASYLQTDESFAFIQKPLTPEALAEKVRAVLDA